MPRYGGAHRMPRVMTAGLWVLLGLAAVLAPPALAQEGWGDWYWWEQTTPTAVQERLDRGADATLRDNQNKLPADYADENEALQGTDVYWRLNDARF